MTWFEIFYYDESSVSCLKFKNDFHHQRYSHIIRYLKDEDLKDTSKGYFCISINQYKYKAHNIIWTLFNSELLNGEIVDHIDGDISNNKISNLRLVSTEKNNRNKKKMSNNSSKVTGVSVHCRRGYLYWTARVSGLDGKRIEKCFSFSKFGGDDAAFAAACEWRLIMIENLNSQGAGYTERHGK